MKRKRFLIDCDGVLSNFSKGAVEVVFNITGLRFSPNDITRFDFCDALGLGRTDRALVMDAISESSTFCANLEPYPEALVGMRRVRELGDVYIVTSPWDTNKTWEYERKKWLRRHFGVDHKHVTHTSAKYTQYGDMFVDDKSLHVTEWLAEHPGKTGVFWRTPHNSAEPVPAGAHSISNWDALIEVARGIA